MTMGREGISRQASSSLGPSSMTVEERRGIMRGGALAGEGEEGAAWSFGVVETEKRGEAVIRSATEKKKAAAPGVGARFSGLSLRRDRDAMNTLSPRAMFAPALRREFHDRDKNCVFCCAC